MKYYKTPHDKKRAFQNPELLLISNEKIIFSWTNTQPLYFYPLSWLDYLESKEFHELQILNGKTSEVKKAIAQLKKGKVHFEKLILPGIEYALGLGHKVSVICNLDEINNENRGLLSKVNILRTRIKDNDVENLKILQKIAGEQILTCAKLYIHPEIKNYQEIAMRVRDTGVDLLHVSKNLIQKKGINPKITISRQKELISLKDLETDNFLVKLPNSIENIFAEKFEINGEYHNSRTCSFSEQRRVLNGKNFYPCYTKHIIENETTGPPRLCVDCACIYENDMYEEIKSKAQKIKKPCFALRYNKNGK